MEGWTKQTMRMLIELYKASPCLWDPRDKDYQKRPLADETRQTIVNSLMPYFPNITFDIVKKKIRNLNTQFMREVKEKKHQISIGLETEETYIPKLWCFQDLNFLMERIDERMKPSSVDIYLEQQKLPLVENNFDNFEEKPYIENLPCQGPDTDCMGMDGPWNVLEAPAVIMSSAATSSSEISPKRTNGKRKCNGESEEQSKKRTSNSSDKASYNDDHFRIFGQLVGCELSKLNESNSVQANIAKKLMSDILFMSYMGRLNDDSKISNF